MSTHNDRPDDHSRPPKPAAARAPRKPLTPAAERALAEAAARQAERDREMAKRPGEVRGPKGLEPTRYGDWERKGLASDF
jgi:hypothetical protein